MQSRADIKNSHWGGNAPAASLKNKNLYSRRDCEEVFPGNIFFSFKTSTFKHAALANRKIRKTFLPGCEVLSREKICWEAYHESMQEAAEKRIFLPASLSVKQFQPMVGRKMVKVEPLPSTESTATLPP